nr:MAG TPA: hypothetical protein [Caudoviricetes sp.]
MFCFTLPELLFIQKLQEEIRYKYNSPKETE